MSDFRDEVRDLMDEALSRMCLESDYEFALDQVADMAEEFFAERLAKSFTMLIMSLNKDLSSAEKQILRDLEDIRSRRKAREKVDAHKEQEAFKSVMGKAEELLKKAKA